MSLLQYHTKQCTYRIHLIILDEHFPFIPYLTKHTSRLHYTICMPIKMANIAHLKWYIQYL